MLSALGRTVFFYFLLMIVIRLLGKRQIGQLEPSELVFTMLVANLATIPMENPDLPIHNGLVPIVTVLVLEVLLSLACLRSVKLRKLLCGKPVILIENGNILQDNLRKTRVTLDELTGHLREKDVLDPRAVQYAILETNGNLSVFPYPAERPATAREAKIPTREQFLPITIISDGHLLSDNLTKAQKDISWVQRVLKERNCTLSDTWLLTVDRSDQIIFYPKDP